MNSKTQNALQEFDALNAEAAELERTIATAQARLVIVGRRIRSLLWVAALRRDNDAVRVEHVAEQKLAAQDPGQPDQPKAPPAGE
jgi:hypothetical protein